jgi:hypothetical protein
MELPMNLSRLFTRRIGRRGGQDASGRPGMLIAVRAAWTARGVIHRAERLTRLAAAPAAARPRR